MSTEEKFKIKRVFNGRTSEFFPKNELRAHNDFDKHVNKAKAGQTEVFLLKDAGFGVYKVIRHQVVVK